MAPHTILIRHADVTPGGGDDPPLNAAGTARAKQLRRVLGDARISAIFVSERQRTQQTAKPLAAHLGLSPKEIGDEAGTVAAILALPSAATVLVIGHTTTLPDICAGLGGPALPAISPTEFDHLFIQTGKRVTHLRYG